MLFIPCTFNPSSYFHIFQNFGLVKYDRSLLKLDISRFCYVGSNVGIFPLISFRPEHRGSLCNFTSNSAMKLIFMHFMILLLYYFDNKDALCHARELEWNTWFITGVHVSKILKVPVCTCTVLSKQPIKLLNLLNISCVFEKKVSGDVDYEILAIIFKFQANQPDFYHYYIMNFCCPTEI